MRVLTTLKPDVARNIAVFLLCALAFSGCGGGGDDLLSKRGSVQGIVTFDGEPVEEGQILFTPTGKEGSVAGSAITDGEYSIPREQGPVAGPHSVAITASRKTGKQIKAMQPAPPGTMIDVKEEYIPAKYNYTTTLSAEIKAGENPDLDFNLTKD
jgi:hypothetical protein